MSLRDVAFVRASVRSISDQKINREKGSEGRRNCFGPVSIDQPDPHPCDRSELDRLDLDRLDLDRLDLDRCPTRSNPVAKRQDVSPLPPLLPVSSPGEQFNDLHEAIGDANQGRIARTDRISAEVVR